MYGDENKNMAMNMDEKLGTSSLPRHVDYLWGLGTPVGSTVKRWQPSIHLGGRSM